MSKGPKIKKPKKPRVEKMEDNLQIFKIQRPVYASHEVPFMQELLVYNQMRTIQDTMNAGPEACKEIFPNNEFKVFVWGKVLPNGRLYMHTRILPQDWPEW